MRKRTKSSSKAKGKAKARKSPLTASQVRDLELMDPKSKGVKGGAVARGPRHLGAMPGKSKK